MLPVKACIVHHPQPTCMQSYSLLHIPVRYPQFARRLPLWPISIQRQNHWINLMFSRQKVCRHLACLNLWIFHGLNTELFVCVCVHVCVCVCACVCVCVRARACSNITQNWSHIHPAAKSMRLRDTDLNCTCIQRNSEHKKCNFYYLNHYHDHNTHAGNHKIPSGIHLAR